MLDILLFTKVLYFSLLSFEFLTVFIPLYSKFSIIFSGKLFVNDFFLYILVFYLIIFIMIFFTLSLGTFPILFLLFFPVLFPIILNRDKRRAASRVAYLCIVQSMNQPSTGDNRGVKGPKVSEKEMVS